MSYRQIHLRKQGKRTLSCPFTQLKITFRQFLLFPRHKRQHFQLIHFPIGSYFLVRVCIHRLYLPFCHFQYRFRRPDNDYVPVIILIRLYINFPVINFQVKCTFRLSFHIKLKRNMSYRFTDLCCFYSLSYLLNQLFISHSLYLLHYFFPNIFIS